MKRFTLALIVAIVAALVVVAPASAEVTLHGSWLSGEAVQAMPPNGIGDLVPSVDLVASGMVNIAIYPTETVVASAATFAVAPDEPAPPAAYSTFLTEKWGFPIEVDFWGPFTTKMSAQSFFAWGPAEKDGTSYTVHGTIRSVPLKRGGLSFTATLVADTKSGDLAMTIITGGSGWGWDDWVIYGKLSK